MQRSAFRTATARASLVAILAATLACAGKDGAAGADGRGVLVQGAAVLPGADCASGGTRVQSGQDANADGSLSAAEVQSTLLVCNGADGAPAQVAPEQRGANCPEGGVAVTVGGGAPTYVCNGAPGSTGATGQDGQSVTMTPEPAGDSCAHGGQRLQVGGGTPTYVCNGAPGSTGATGQDGASVTMTPEPAGLACVFGGVALQVGSGPVSYLCSGAPVGVTLPTVETAGVTGVRYREATVNAVVTASGGELVFARGVVLATHPDPTLDDAIAFSGEGTGAFAAALVELAPATEYWARPFAANALGTSYGEAVAFTTLALTVPTLSTHAASNVTATTAISGGDVTDDGGTPILGRGICWAVTADPALGGSCAAEGSGAGSFLALATGLVAGTPYHVRAYATNEQGTAYGEDLTFTTAALPLAVVTTAAPSAVSYTSATGGGTVVGDNGAPVTSRGICWATTHAPTTADAKYVEAGGVGTFSGPITGLATGTTYYVRAFAVNGAGTSYGNEVSLATPAATLPSLTTKPVTGVSSDLAGSGGVISSDGGSPITAKGVCWDVNANPRTTFCGKTNDGAGPASFNSTMTGLAKLTTYHVVAYATNALGTAYGNDVAFTTTDLVNPGTTPPIVGTTTSALTSGSTASSGGFVSSDGGSPVTARGVCWGTSANPALGASTCSTDGTGVGFFSSSVTGLSGCNTVWYVRAYATNAYGTSYGAQATITTGLLPAVTTAAVTNVGVSGATSGGTITDNGGCPVTQKGVVWNLSPNPTTGNARTNDGAGDASYASTLTGLYSNRTYYVRAYVTTVMGTAYGQQEVFTTAEPAGPYLGKNYAGGIVFYVDGTGQHGLVVSAADLGAYPWGCPGTNVPTSTAFGAGASNTAAIVGSCADANAAARIADALVLNGYDDWFLPSTGEVAQMYGALVVQGLGGLGYVATSSQSDPSSFYYYYLPGNSAGTVPKTYVGVIQVRPVRAF